MGRSWKNNNWAQPSLGGKKVGFFWFHFSPCAHMVTCPVSFRAFFLLASMLRSPCFPLAFLFLKRGGEGEPLVLQSCPKYMFCYLSIPLSMKNTVGLNYLDNGKEGCQKLLYINLLVVLWKYTVFKYPKGSSKRHSGINILRGKKK